MAKYGISGVWKNANNVVSHYAFHTEGKGFGSRAEKKTKAEAIALLEIEGNSAFTWSWNYSKARWSAGEAVQGVQRTDGKYLRSNPDDWLTDNLAHLIDFG